MNDSIWEVMSSFEQYWGTKLLNSLKALHGLYVKKIDPQQDAEGGPRRNDEHTTAGSNQREGDEENLPRYDNSFFTKMQDSNEEDI